MADSLPSYTKTVDDAFVDTWYTIREEAIDNILAATPTWAALAAAGCMVTQEGGEIITRTIRYGQYTAVDVEEGDVMTPGDPNLETMAWWFWKYIAVNIGRSTIKDAENSGPHRIKSYVGNRISAARDGLEQKFEDNIWSAHKTVETGKVMQGIHDLVPTKTQAEAGNTYGNIPRAGTYALANGIYRPSGGTNPWWGLNYVDGVLASIDTDLLDNMKTLYNGIGQNQQPPNLFLTTQAIFEIYEDYAVDISQIVKDETTRLADLGFEVLRFKGKPLMWTSDCTANTMFALNTDWIEIVYNPILWFDMTDWKPVPYELDRAAQIVCACNMISSQLRRHGMAWWD